MGWQEPTGADHGYPVTRGEGHPVTRGEQGLIRASDADRDHVAGMLGTAYTEGRLSRDEYDARLAAVFSARTYADLHQVVKDLPAAQPPAVSPVSPVAKTNAFAMASLACGLAQFMVGPIATIPAIVLGYMARNEINRTGERGAGLALAGLVLGWMALILGIVLVTAGLVISARTPG
jgi:Domain of unknown function (DUF1707)/Domain of unknown function (DUF4190)